MLQHFPKIWRLGAKQVLGIFDGPVEITEKIDGSQFVFGLNDDGVLYMRSKGAAVYKETADKNFAPVVEHVMSVEERLPYDTVFYGETLARPRHNTLCYESVPKGHFMLFGVSDFDGENFLSSYDYLENWAKDLEVDVVPLLFNGYTTKSPIDIVEEFLEKESVLGGPNIEGVVVKNYNKEVMVGGHVYPIMAGKYVSEKFKEVHGSNKNFAKGKNKLEDLKESYKAEARWEKAIQALHEKGLLQDDAPDIGPLIKEIQRDIIEEEEETIKQALWVLYKDEILRHSIRGFPEWYKERLVRETHTM